MNTKTHMESLQIIKPINLEKVESILRRSLAFFKLQKSMIPSNIILEDIFSSLGFLKPSIVVLHGSFVSKLRFSEKKQSDYDLIIISKKIPFWPLNELYDEINNKLSKLENKIKIDISLVSLLGIMEHLKGKTSLGQSLLQGFTILGRI